MGIFAEFDRIEQDALTPIDKTICKNCGSKMIMIGLTGVQPPLTAHPIWKTIFSELCVHTDDWTWCCGGAGMNLEGRLLVNVPR